jgi:hypothetical protein
MREMSAWTATCASCDEHCTTYNPYQPPAPSPVPTCSGMPCKPSDANHQASCWALNHNEPRARASRALKNA